MRRVAIVITTVAVSVTLVVGMAIGSAACGDGTDEATPTATVTVTVTPSPSPADASPATAMTLSLYFLRSESLGLAHRTVPHTSMPATAAMEALLAGPNGRERAARLSSAVPDGTGLNGVTITGGVATVDVGPAFAGGGGSLSVQARVAQVVYTLTEFDTVDAVRILIDGEPVEALGGEGVALRDPQRRADWAEFLPAIFVASPAVGDVVSSPLHVTGDAMVFEATFVLEVLDPRGDVLTRKAVMAEMGAPERGDFSTRLKFATADDRVVLRAYQVSMADGSRLDEVRIPVRLAARE